MASGVEKTGYAVGYVPAPHYNAPRNTRLVRTALLLSSAALLSTLLPASWTSTGLLNLTTNTPAASVADPAEEWKDDIG